MAYDSVILADNPLIYYELEETSGTVVTDSSGHGYHGAYVGGPALQDPHTPLACTPAHSVYFHDSSSYPFNSSQYIQLPSFPLAVSAVSIEGWYRGDTSFGVGAGHAWDIGTGTNWFAMRPNIASSYLNVVDHGGAGDAGNQTSSWWNVGTAWHQFVAVIDRVGGTIKTYLDGALTLSTTDSNTGTFWASDSGRLFSLVNTDSGIDSAGGPDPELAGYLARWALYNYALTAGQILNHYNAASVTGPCFEALPTFVGTWL